MLSIVMPARNVEKYLKPALDSLINQTYTDWELIFVDDQSTDSTAEIAKSYNDSRIKYFLTDESKGVAHARNFGSSRASSDIIAVADSDDIYYPDRLAKTMKAFDEDENLAVFYSNIRIIDHINNTKTIRPFQAYDHEILKNINYIANMAAAYKKKDFEAIGGYDENLRSAEDYDLWLRFAAAGFKIYGLDEVLVDVNRYSESTSANRESLKNYTHIVKEKNGLPKVSDLEYVREHASEEIFKHFTQPRGYALWFE